ncbi:HAD-IA family hydrolase [Candidatus Woesearchaeota archaeon]|nr:HAD-IA family hydrolase [Candidatus Woesearchaeota archaeon]
MIRAVLFDIDGTLLDSEKANIAFYQRVFGQAGYKIPTAEEMAAYWHLRRYDMIDVLARDLPESKRRELEEFSRTVDYPRELLKVFPYSSEAVQDLSVDHGLGLVSNRTRDRIGDYLKISEVERLFGTVVGVDQVQYAKPHPEPLLKALKVLGVAAVEAIYVGDTFVDVEAAHAAKMKGVFLYRSTAPGADIYFDSYQELGVLVRNFR